MPPSRARSIPLGESYGGRPNGYQRVRGRPHTPPRSTHHAASSAVPALLGSGPQRDRTHDICISARLRRQKRATCCTRRATCCTLSACVPITRDRGLPRLPPTSIRNIRGPCRQCHSIKGRQFTPRSVAMTALSSPHGYRHAHRHLLRPPSLAPHYATQLNRALTCRALTPLLPAQPAVPDVPAAMPHSPPAPGAPILQPPPAAAGERPLHPAPPP